MNIIKFAFRIKAQLFWFLLINVFFGGMGIWAPVIGSNGTYAQNFNAVLDSGGLYTFICAYLAAAGGYVIFEYLSKNNLSLKKIKATFIGVALVVTVISGFFAGKKINATNINLTNHPFDFVQIKIALFSILIGFILGLIQFYSENGMNEAVENNKNETKEKVEELFN